MKTDIYIDEESFESSLMKYDKEESINSQDEELAYQ